MLNLFISRNFYLLVSSVSSKLPILFNYLQCYSVGKVTFSKWFSVSIHLDMCMFFRHNLQTEALHVYNKFLLMFSVNIFSYPKLDCWFRLNCNSIFRMSMKLLQELFGILHLTLVMLSVLWRKGEFLRLFIFALLQYQRWHVSWLLWH